MLGPVEVLLQRETPARRHHDPLHLEALADVDALIPAPGAVHPTVGVRLRMRLLAQDADEILHPARLRLGGDQHRVGGRHHHHVFQADHRGQTLTLAMHEAVTRADQLDAAPQCVALRVTLKNAPDRIPGADIRPREGDRQHTGPGRPLHHRVVDRGFGRPREGVGLKPHEVQIGDGVCECRAGGLQHLGRMHLQLGQHHIGAEQEVAGVPQRPLPDQPLGAGGVRLLDEALDPLETRRVGKRAAGTDIAVLGRGPGRGDAERHDLAEPGTERGLPRGAGEGGGVLDHVVGSHHQHHHLRPSPRAVERSYRHGGSGVASLGFE